MKLQVILVPHTHWDREWYQTFQEFRVRLVHTINRLLDILDRDSAFTYFLLDGQSVILDDYLEICPEQEGRLRHYIQAGRILIGPWYTQPDEFLVSGEALIRNLQMGMRRARDFGDSMKVGYVPDSFGHIGQLPQILQGVGIDSAIFWRGVDNDVTQSEFLWQAPNGSQVLVVYLSDFLGYSNARNLPLQPESLAAESVRLASQILHKASTNTLLFMNGSDHLPAQDGLPAAITQANILLQNLTDDQQQVLSQNSAQPDAHYTSLQLEIGTIPIYLERIRAQTSNLPIVSHEFRSSRYANLLPGVLSTRLWLKQENDYTQQLLERWVEPFATWAWQLGNPYPHGLLRQAWRLLLLNHAHDSICGCSLDQVHRENAVRFSQSQQIGESLLLESLQQIASQVDTRPPFAGDHSLNEPLPLVIFQAGAIEQHIPVHVDVNIPGTLQQAVIVDENGELQAHRVVQRQRQEIGTQAFAREMIATAVMLSGIHTPAQMFDFAQQMLISALGESAEELEISHIYIENYTDPSVHHQEIPTQPGDVRMEVLLAPKGRLQLYRTQLEEAAERILQIIQDERVQNIEITLLDQAQTTIELLTNQVPASGYRTYWLYPRGLPDVLSHKTAAPTTIKINEHSLENEYYHLEVNHQDGTITLTDKESGAIFPGLHRIIDEGDVGDTYNFSPVEQGGRIVEPSEPVKTEILEQGPVRVALRIRGKWALPSACSANRKERSARLTICPIVVDIELVPGERIVHIHTSIENNVKDHRLRVLFPIPYQAERVATEGTFEVCERSIGGRAKEQAQEWYETPVESFPQKRFLSLSDGHQGFSIFNRGLPEAEILGGDDEIGEGPIVALTLLRGVEWLSRGDLTTRRGHAGPQKHTPEAQVLGSVTAEYALAIHRGTWSSDQAWVLRQAQNYQARSKYQAIVTNIHAGNMPGQQAFVRVEPASIVVSAVKPEQDGGKLVLRIYNPLTEAMDARIQLRGRYQHVLQANLLEESKAELFIHQTAPDLGEVKLQIGAGEIQTLLLQ